MENKATKVDGTAAWRHADGMTDWGRLISPQMSSGQNWFWSAPTPAYMLKTVTLAILSSFCFHCTSIFTFCALWAVHGWLATVEYMLTISARHTRDWLHGYMAAVHYLVLHRHGGTTG